MGDEESGFRFGKDEPWVYDGFATFIKPRG
jgi:hypothetical protein